MRVMDKVKFEIKKVSWTFRPSKKRRLRALEMSATNHPVAQGPFTRSRENYMFVLVTEFTFLINFLNQNQFAASINTLNLELNPICYLLALLGAHHFLHVSRIRVKILTFRRLMSYIYIWSTHS